MELKIKPVKNIGYLITINGKAKIYKTLTGAINADKKAEGK